MKAAEFREILTYIPAFRRKTFVLNIDSWVLAGENLASLFLDIAVLRSLNIYVVLTYGLSVQLKQLAEERGMNASDLDGTGVVDSQTLELAKTVSGLNAQLILQGLADSDLKGALVNAAAIHPRGILGGQDYGFAGKVEKVEAEVIRGLLENGVIPVIAPVGFDGEGNVFRANSDNVAVETAKAIQSAKLIFLTTQNGLTQGQGLISQMSVEEAADYLNKNRETLPADMISKLEHSIFACRNGVNRVHLLDGRQDGVLIEEIFSNEGVGTMIYANEYTAVRKAQRKDIRELMTLIQSSMVNEELAGRSREEVLTDLEDFYVFEIDRNIVGCVAVHIMTPETAEMACLFVSEKHANQGIGRKLMHFAEDLAKEKRVKQLIALSTQAFNYLQKKGGFEEAGEDVLPPERKKDYEKSGRNSKILIKSLQSPS